MLDLETPYHYVCDKQEEPIYSIPSRFCLPFAILKSAFEIRRLDEAIQRCLHGNSTVKR